MPNEDPAKNGLLVNSDCIASGEMGEPRLPWQTAAFSPSCFYESRANPDAAPMTVVANTRASLRMRTVQPHYATFEGCKTRSNFAALGNGQWPHLEELARTRRPGVEEIGWRSVPLRYTFCILDCDSSRVPEAGRRAAFCRTFWYPLGWDPCGRNAFRFFHSTSSCSPANNFPCTYSNRATVGRAGPAGRAAG